MASVPGKCSGMTFFLFVFMLGMGVNLLLINPEKAIKLAVNDQVRQLYGGKR